jgi:hypothetical protein
MARFKFFLVRSVNGVFNIPNVPAGYYWLEISPRDIYWTSSSNFDMGHDYAAQKATVVPTTSTTNISFQLTGLDPTTGSGWIQVLLPVGPMMPFENTTSPGSSTGTVGAIINGNVDYSGYKNAFMTQYEPAALSPVNGFALGPELSVTNLALTNGAVNTINETLNPPVPASMDLAIKASEWTPLFDHVAPSAPSAMGGVFDASVQPYGTAQIVNAAQNINLIWSPSSGNFGPALLPSCFGASSSFSGLPALPPALATDFDAGTVQYSDPFPTTWLRSFSVLQCAAVSIALPGGNSTQTFILTNSQSTALPTAALEPLISPVQNPKINGADLFAANTIGGTAVTLSWSAPAIGKPSGYQVQISIPTTLPSGASVYSPVATLSTAKTKITVPLNLLPPNGTCLFVITALVDGQANMETSPHHSALPVASADVVSAPITINPAQ